MCGFRDIRFWIIFFFLVRLIGIINPPLEVAHNWRQTTVTMVSRNFLEVDNNIFYPRIDIAGEKSGITGMEFPIFNYIIYLVSEVFGYEHWYGRLINLLFSSLGIFFFYKLVKKYFQAKIAFNSTLILLFSIWFSYSRKVMPDTFSMSFIIASIYYGSNYLDNKLRSNKLKDILLYSLLMVIGMLSKLPSAYLLIVFLIFMLNTEIPHKRKLVFIIVSCVSLVLPLIWYFYWVPHLVETYGFWHFFMGVDIIQGICEIGDNLPETFQKFYDSALKYIGFAFFVFGLVQVIVRRQNILLSILILSFLSFLIIIFKAGYAFPHHSYYIIPFVPIMSLFAGYGLSLIKNNKVALIFLIAISIEGILNQQHDFRIHDKEKALMNLETDLDSISKRDDLILINSGEYPTPMYFAHRNGWINYNNQIKDEQYIQNLKETGLKFIVILKRSFGSNIILDLPIILENKDYCIYQP